MKIKTLFYCTECGNETPKWQGKCSACGAWNTVVEQPTDRSTRKKSSESRTKGSALGVPVRQPQQITEVETFHDDANGTKRGTNIVRVFEYEGLTLAHFGDLGHILTEEQAEAIGPVDVALIPVGGFYTIDPQQALEVAQQVEAKVVIPMHYRTEDFGFDVIAHINDFTSLCEDVVFTDEDTIVIDENTPQMTAVLKPHFIKKQEL